MRSVVVVIEAIVIGLTIGACSSSTAPSALPAGALPEGTAEVTINGTGKTTAYDVNCTRVQSYTLIDARQHDSRLRATVNNASGLTVDSVYVDNLSSFSGSYVKDLTGEVKIGAIAQTYVISGVAEGFYADRPSFTAKGSFDIKVAC